MRQPALEGGFGGRSRRRCTRAGAAEQRTPPLWAPKWRCLVSSKGGAPEDYTEFDRTVRGVLNRVSRENASRILPLEPSLRGAEAAAGGDCPAWWAVRFAALMLSSYVQAIRSNRHARGLAIRSADNVLPGYLDAVAPLLVNSPRLVTALMAGFAHLLHWEELCWPTTRLLLLAAREERDRETLPCHALGRLPADLIQGRILGFLVPPRTPAVEGLLADPPVAKGGCLSGEDAEKDVVAVLAHVIMFAPLAIWPRLSAFGFCLVEAALAEPQRCSEREVYLAASILITLAERIEAGADSGGRCDIHDRSSGDRDLAKRLAALLHEAAGGHARRQLSAFAACRVQAALDHSLLTQ
mmetsp:Transcript_72318/g.215805  ORF Transcript_72318/g.215805 Transcript_72318/m.215805 type:complete len:354 (+) Transcript_72318:147-1208(+)